MKRQYSLLIALILSFIVAGVAAAQEAKPRIWLSFSADQAVAGEEVTVTVNITGAVGVYGTSFQLTYDAAALEVVAADNQVVMPGSFWGSAPSFPLTNRAEAGLVDYALTLVQPAEPVSGDGVLGTVTFRALRDTAVVVTTSAASLVAPEFAEVNGRKVAQKMDTIVPEGTGSAANAVVESNPGAAQSAPVVSSGVASVSVAEALAARQAGSPSVVTAPQTLNPVTASSSDTNLGLNPAVIFAGLLFLVGIVLLLVSVGVYTRMRGVNWVRE